MVVYGLKSGMSLCWDGMTVAIVKCGLEFLKGSLLRLYNICVRYGIFLNVWRRGVVVTLLKGKGRDVGSASSYRPICLLPVLGKIL